MPNDSGRQLWHFLSYLVQDYRFDYEMLRVGEIGSFREVLMTSGFAEWKRKFGYDNYSSAYLGFVLESVFGTGLEEILHTQLLNGTDEKERLLFHPVLRGVASPSFVVPTSMNKSGLVHDCLASSHSDENLSVAGVFSNAQVVADVFHRTIDEIIHSGFYGVGSQNQLQKAGIDDHVYAMGFDLPYPQSLETSVDNPIIFAGYTGCRLFFAERPRVTICFVTNRVLKSDSVESRKKFSMFSWRVIREILRQCC